MEIVQTNLLAAVGLLGLLVIAILLVVHFRRRGGQGLRRLIQEVSSDALIDVFIPDGLGGEIHIDHLLLTPHGLILLETKDIQGAVFAGDRLDTWSATLDGQRATFSNPIPMLEERVAALKLLAPGMPIESRVLFISPVTFPKGHPETVSTVASLIEEYASHRSVNKAYDVQPHWDAIKAVAIAS